MLRAYRYGITGLTWIQSAGCAMRFQTQPLSEDDPNDDIG